MKQTDPLKFADKLKWLDGSPLLGMIEPYRRRDFRQRFTRSIPTVDRNTTSRLPAEPRRIGKPPT